ncbi:MAG: hypothetical protein ACT4QC_14830 [Planctomycetaceae bacterium]
MKRPCDGKSDFHDQRGQGLAARAVSPATRASAVKIADDRPAGVRRESRE